MSELLPVYVNPENATARGLETSGMLLLQKMARLSDRLLVPNGQVEVELVFGREGKRKFLRGHIKGEMILECQRCMSDMTLNVDHQFQLGILASDAELDQLLPGEEPLIADHDRLYLADIVSDELELLLPMVAMHADENCHILQNAVVPNATVGESSEATKSLDGVEGMDEPLDSKTNKSSNAFSVLSVLKNSFKEKK